MTNPHNYKLKQELIFNAGSLTEIAGLYVAYRLGSDKLNLGLSILLIVVVVNNILARGWLWLYHNGGKYGNEHGSSDTGGSPPTDSG